MSGMKPTEQEYRNAKRYDEFCESQLKLRKIHNNFQDQIQDQIHVLAQAMMSLEKDKRKVIFWNRDYRRRRTTETNEQIAEWVHENLVPGDIVKMKGTRDHGFRKVLEVKQNVLVLQKLQRSSKYPPESWQDDRYITEQMPCKVSKIWKEDKWIPIKTLLKNTS